MKSLWNDQEAERHVGVLDQRVYTSRLLGAEPSLVMHGGGNTSVKSRIADIFGQEEDILYVKGSGWDLGTIAAAGFAPCRMSHLLRMAELTTLSDTQMALELRKSLVDPNAPMPSVEAILHAIIPARFVDHTHADAVLTITNTPDGEARVRELFGNRVVYIPYVMPGFELARLCAELYPRHAGPDTVGMLLLHHGLFTFGATARSAYDRMIDLVSEAEQYIASRGERRRVPVRQSTITSDSPQCLAIAALRTSVSEAAGTPMIVAVHGDAEALEFARRVDLEEVSQRGPATPDHVIRTKRVPMIGRDVGGFVGSYRRYFQEFGNEGLTMLDPAPRVILDAQLGLCTVGRSAKDAEIAHDIYRHTMKIIREAQTLGGWRALSPAEIFAVEYWDLEQAKLRKSGKPPMFSGEVVVVTGAASGIGKACVAAFLTKGAAVVGIDVHPDVTRLHDRPDFLGIQCDLTDEKRVALALEQAVRAFGGVDMLVLNAGIFPKSAAVESLPVEQWRKVMSINLDANLVLLREAHALLRLAPAGGRVVVIGSKNVAAPGPGAAAYSASKAALQQLVRVTALEWGKDRIRINTLHPNAVFDTAIWTAEVLEERARSYGMDVQQYKTNNVLKVEVTSADVGELAAVLCGPMFAKTTGAQIPVDGGNVRVI